MPPTENDSAETIPAIPAETPAVEQAQPVAAPDPNAALLQQMREEMAAERALTFQAMREGFTMLASSQRPPVATETGLTDEQIETAIQEGRGAQAIRAEIARATRESAAAIKRETVDPLAALVQTQGVDAIAALAMEQARNGVSEDMRPYVTQYQREIDEAVNGMQPQQRLRVDNIRHAQAIILGHHLPEIVRAEREKVIRQFREDPSSLPGHRPVVEAGPKVPSAVELFGKNSVEARMVRDAGGEDAYIAKQAGKSKYAAQSWAQYVERHQRMHGQATEGNA